MKRIDRFRAMSAEELAEMLGYKACYWCSYYDKPNDKCSISIATRNNNHCRVGITEGLNQEINPMPDLEAGDVVKTAYGEYVAIGGAVLVNPTTFARNFLGNLVDNVRFIYRYDGAEKEYETIWSADNG